MAATAPRRRRRRQPQADVRVRIEYVDIDDITPYERNPRDNDPAVESTKNSIETFGFIVPVILDTEGVIVAGHTRYAAARQLEMTEVPCIYAEHLSSQQLAQFRIIDNKVAELARWDFDLLAGEISVLADTGLDFTRYGFTREELDCLGDVVADDCLSAGNVTDLDDQERRRRRERRAPAQTRFVCGEFVFFIPREVYQRWASQVRTECDYDEAEITSQLKEGLGITPYEEGA